MFTNDLLQSQLSMGAYGGAISPFNSPYTTPQTAVNPAAFNPVAGIAQNGGISPFGQQGYYGGNPNYALLAQQQQQLQQQLQQLQQLAAVLASQGAVPQIQGASPQSNPWQNPQQSNAFQNPAFQNPLIAASLQNPLVNSILAQQLALQGAQVYGQPQFGQAPFPQAPFVGVGYQLAPQSWVGQQIPGQIHPHHLQQLAARGLY